MVALHFVVILTDNFPKQFYFYFLSMPKNRLRTEQIVLERNFRAPRGAGQDLLNFLPVCKCLSIGCGEATLEEIEPFDYWSKIRFWGSIAKASPILR